MRFDEALRVKPDMILWVLAPSDIEQDLAIVNHPQKADRSIPLMLRAWRRIKLVFGGTSSASAIEETFNLTRTSFLLRHFLFESQSQFVKSYLMGGDDETGFLKVKSSAEWSERLRQFCSAAAENEARAKVAGVPLVAVLVPNRVQAAMISMGEWPAEYDPYKLDNQVRSIITSHGGTYIDILPDYRGILSPEQDYFPVDGHPDADGHALIARLLTKGLTSGAVPALKAASQPQVASEQSR